MAFGDGKKEPKAPGKVDAMRAMREAKYATAHPAKRAGSTPVEKAKPKRTPKKKTPAKPEEE